MEKLDIFECLLTHNDCYQLGAKFKPIGVMVHSTGADNPYLRRYVQPRPDESNYDRKLGFLGKNYNNNSWNRSRREGANDTCVHYFIGLNAIEEVEISQTLPLSIRAWHAGNGTNGTSANRTHLSFEVCENRNDLEYTRKAVQKAVELCAYLCALYGWDPMERMKIISHQEGYKAGIASNHGDIDSYIKLIGMDMNAFRKEVEKVMRSADSPDEVSEWAKDAVNWAKENGITDGTRMRDICTREEIITMLYRYHNLNAVTTKFERG